MTWEEALSDKVVTDAILDTKTEKESAHLVRSLRAREAECRITLVSHEPFTPALLETLSATYGPLTLLPNDLSPEEAGAAVRSFFPDPEAPLLVSPELVKRYHLHLFETLKELFSTLEALRKEYTKERLKTLYTEVHKISGSGASYGFRALGAVCRQLALYLAPLLEKEEPLPPHFFPLCTTWLRHMLLGFQKIALIETPPLKETREREAPLPPLVRPTLYVVSPDPLVQRLFATHASAKQIAIIEEVDPHRALDALQSGKISPSCLILEREYPVDQLTFEDFLSLFSSETRPKIGIVIVKKALSELIGFSKKKISFFLQKPLTDHAVAGALEHVLEEKFPEDTRALILDDDPYAAEILKKALEPLHITTKILLDEKEIFTALENFLPHIIFFDLGLKVYCGCEVLKMIRSDVTYQHLVLIVYTATRTKEVLERCSRDGIEYILFKPLDREELNRILHLILPFLTKEPDYERDLNTELLHERQFEAHVGEICRTSHTHREFILLFIQFQDFAALKHAYDDETRVSLLRGLHREVTLYFKSPYYIGKIAEETIGLLLPKTKKQAIALAFDRLCHAFFKDIQVYTSVERPLYFHAAALCFSAHPDTTYPLLEAQIFDALEKIAPHLGNRVVIEKFSPLTDASSLSPSVVLVDGNSCLVELLSEAFKKKGFQVKSFSEGQPAIDYLFSFGELPEQLVLILDRLLPDMDGVDLLNKISLRFGKRVHTIFLSELTIQEEVVKEMEEGNVDYIFKPFSTALLVNKVKALLALC